MDKETVTIGADWANYQTAHKLEYMLVGIYQFIICAIIIVLMWVPPAPPLSVLWA